jgi:DNA-binding response OmpR family regulator
MTAILYIEDAEELAVAVVRELTLAGFTVTRAASGEEGLRCFAAAPPALVLLDWMLPGMDGLAVLHGLRQHSAVPVLMLTARGEELDRVQGLEVGADDYLTKPFSMLELIARVRALLRRVELVRAQLAADRATSGDRISNGLLVLDSAAHVATLMGVSLDLSPTEFALLHLLLRQPGRAFSRAYLIETVWGGTAIEGDRSVDNVILRLRKKLGPMGARIETVWGIGYRLQPEAAP